MKRNKVNKNLKCIIWIWIYVTIFFLSLSSRNLVTVDNFDNAKNIISLSEMT